MNTHTTLNTASGKALITGASTGIGAIYADRLARRGHDLVLVARSGEKLAALARSLAASTGRSVETLVADLTTREGMALVERRLVSDEAIDTLVNNAGVGAAGGMLDMSADALDDMIQLNVVALTRLARAAVPGFVARGRGTVINIASIVALAPELLNGTYSGSKAYVVNFSQSLHNEVSAKGVQVQAVLPGATRTEFWDVAGMPVTNLPQDWVMSADDLVDAALAGLDSKELITIPPLEDIDAWKRFEAARLALAPGLSRSSAATRYRAAQEA